MLIDHKKRISSAMIKLGKIEFDERILDALRDENLVVFAGAGVSMGPPSNLPNFQQLAGNIAQGAGLLPSGPLDRFLGQLQHKKVSVHERAANLLSPEGSAPNSLHHDLLRLFGTAKDVRLVTTNFDEHFETAATAVFNEIPDVYSAPALPLGYDFAGIVHVHGTLSRVRDLVLTDVDFGRAYLTEGWARRFLVDVFRRYTVLFVGYSHDDVVMNYLARALPANGIAGRFALTEKDGSWDLLGVKPLRFICGTGEDSHRELYDSIQKLAERAARGALDWQTKIAETCRHQPPIDEETICEVEQALREVHTTRFFANVARSPAWLKWLDSRAHLDALFGPAHLSARDELLARWVAEHFAIEHSEAVFELIAGRSAQLNPMFWWALGRELGVTTEKPIAGPTLERWVTLLLSRAPEGADWHVLLWLAERCAAQALVAPAMKAFLWLSAYSLSIKSSVAWHEEEGAPGTHLKVDCPIRADHWSLNEVWSKYLSPSIASIAQPLLSSIIQRLEEMHTDLVSWDKASPSWDPTSYGRAAIERHEQDEYPEAVDVLIDAARDALESLAANSPVLVNAWIERLITAKAPLLRRLAIHAMTADRTKSADERLAWLLNRVGLHEYLEHHEIHRAVALNYAAAQDEVRQDVVCAVLAHRRKASDNQSAEERTAWAHFEWLSWLLSSKPDCALAAAPLEKIRSEYPEWKPSDNPDLTHWMSSGEWVGSESPWTVEQLLSRQVSEQLDELLSFRGTGGFSSDGRDGLFSAVLEACKHNAHWTVRLADAIAQRSLWHCDLWPAVIRGLAEAESQDAWSALLEIAGNPELQQAHTSELARALHVLVKDGGRTFALKFLQEANAIALGLWHRTEPYGEVDDFDCWLTRAINRPAGVIAQFWLNGLSLLVRSGAVAGGGLPENYRLWFSMVLGDSSQRGGLGRTVLASHTAFFFKLDEIWTRLTLIPLFSNEDRHIFAQAWHGFLTWGRLQPPLAEALRTPFMDAVLRLEADLSRRRHRFIEFYTAMATFHETDPTNEFLPVLLSNGKAEDRVGFSSQMTYFLKQMTNTARTRLWDAWLNRYWLGRLESVPVPLDEDEIRAMVDWSTNLDDQFPAAVALITRFPPIRMTHCDALYELRSSDLVTRYPAETAELLIFFCNCVVGYMVSYIGVVASRLPPLPPPLGKRLAESLAKTGAAP